MLGCMRVLCSVPQLGLLIICLHTRIGLSHGNVMPEMHLKGLWSLWDRRGIERNAVKVDVHGLHGQQSWRSQASRTQCQNL